MTPVSAQLEIERAHARKMSRDGSRIGRVEGPMRQVLLPIMKPYAWYWLFRRSTVTNADWVEQLHGGVLEFDKNLQQPDRVVVFGRIPSNQRWWVIYSGEWPMSFKVFRSAVSTMHHSHDATDWCVVWGRAKQEARTVITLFADKWMVYDRYGKFKFRRSAEVGAQPSEPRPHGPRVMVFWAQCLCQ